MMIKKKDVLKVLCCIGYGLFIVTALIQSFDAYAENIILTEIGKIGLGFGAVAMLFYLSNRNEKE